MLQSYPLFLLLLPLFFVGHGLVEHAGHIPLNEAFLLLGIYLAAAGIFWLVFRRFLPSWLHAGLMSFSLLTFHFFFGAIQDLLRTSWPGSFVSRYVFLLPAALILFVLLFRWLRSKTRPVARLSYFINLLLLLLILIDLGQWSYNRLQQRSHPVLPAGTTACTHCDSPDIFLIMADEYAGDRSLRDLFSFNDSAFYRQLEQRGFRVLRQSASNYNYTPYSIASTLNMDYLDLDRRGKKPLLAYCYETIANNQLLGFLRYQGYQLLNYSYFDFPGQPTYTQETFLPNRTRLITGQTFLSRIEKEMRFQLSTRFNLQTEARKQAYFNKGNNDKLYELTLQAASEKPAKPRFVFTHLMLPHYPYYFDHDGRAYPFESLQEGKQYDTSHYLGYLQWANGQYLKLIDSIMAHSRRPPLIVLMSDHGFRHFNRAIDPYYYFSNLVAVHLPGDNNRLLADSLTNVNLFRAILNIQFKQQLPLLRDSSYVLDNP